MSLTDKLLFIDELIDKQQEEINNIVTEIKSIAPELTTYVKSLNTGIKLRQALELVYSDYFKIKLKLPPWREFIGLSTESINEKIKLAKESIIKESNERILMYNQSKTNLVELNKCPECNQSNLVERQGLIICKECGLELGKQFISSEMRAFTVEEVNKRKRTEPRWRNFGPRTTLLNENDYRGNPVNDKSKIRRLSKIQSSLVGSIERNFWESTPKLKQYCIKLGVPDYVRETSWMIYSLAAKKKLTRGRSIDDLVVASIYSAIRIHRVPRLLDEVVEVCDRKRSSVHKGLGLIQREVLPELGFKYEPITAEELVYKFGNELKIHIKYQKEAHNLITQATNNGLKRTGKDPKGIAASAIYIILKKTDQRMTQAEISKEAMITEVTLRSRVKQIMKTYKV